MQTRNQSNNTEVAGKSETAVTASELAQHGSAIGVHTSGDPGVLFSFSKITLHKGQKMP